MSRLGQCAAAVSPLSQASLLPTGDLADEATLALGRCQLETGDPASADLAFSSLIDNDDKYVRAEARYQHGRALRMTGHYEEAAAVLRGETGSRAADELLIALAGAGRDAETDSLTRQLLASGDTRRGGNPHRELRPIRLPSAAHRSSAALVAGRDGRAGHVAPLRRRRRGRPCI